MASVMHSPGGYTSENVSGTGTASYHPGSIYVAKTPTAWIYPQRILLGDPNPGTRDQTRVCVSGDIDARHINLHKTRGDPATIALDGETGVLHAAAGFTSENVHGTGTASYHPGSIYVAKAPTAWIYPQRIYLGDPNPSTRDQTTVCVSGDVDARRMNLHKTRGDPATISLDGETGVLHAAAGFTSENVHGTGTASYHPGSIYVAKTPTAWIYPQRIIMGDPNPGTRDQTTVLVSGDVTARSVRLGGTVTARADSVVLDGETGTVGAERLTLRGLPCLAGPAAAAAVGLPHGTVYRDPDGFVRIVTDSSSGTVGADTAALHAEIAELRAALADVRAQLAHQSPPAYSPAGDKGDAKA